MAHESDTTIEDPASVSEALSSSDAYDILADTRRRYTIHYLKQHDGEDVPVQEVAEHVAAWENEKPVAELTAQERKRVYISLYQSHLSTLADQGFIEYDEDQGVVSLTDPVSQSDIYLEIVSQRDIRWGYFYFGLSVAAGALFTLRWIEFGVIGDIPMIVLVGLMIFTYALAAAVHIISSGRKKLGDDGPPPELRERPQ